MKQTVVIKHTGMLTRGLPHELKLFTLNYLYFISYWAGLVASTVGATGEGVGCSLPGGTTFSSVKVGVMSTSDLGSTLLVG